MGPKWPKSGVFWQFLDFDSLDFSDFVYYDRHQYDNLQDLVVIAPKNNKWVQIEPILDLS